MQEPNNKSNRIESAYKTTMRNSVREGPQSDRQPTEGRVYLTIPHRNRSHALTNCIRLSR